MTLIFDFSDIFPDEEFIYEDLKEKELTQIKEEKIEQCNIESDSLCAEFESEWITQDVELITEEEVLGMKSCS